MVLLEVFVGLASEVLNEEEGTYTEPRWPVALVEFWAYRVVSKSISINQ